MLFSTLTACSSGQIKELTMDLEITGNTHKEGEEIELGLTFRNDKEEPLRLHFIENENFRFNSSVTVLKKEDRSPINPPFIAPPHGYILSEKDFYMLQPGEELRFQQSLEIKEPGEYILVWNYKNEGKVWKGGIETLDGPTVELFNGEEVPNIWVGENSVEKMLEIAKK